MASAPVTAEEHRLRHVALHKAFDELLADWIAHLPLGAVAGVLDRSILELITWSHEQTIAPKDRPA